MEKPKQNGIKPSAKVSLQSKQIAKKMSAMTIKLDLKPEIENRLIAQATVQEVSVERYLELLIERHLATQAELHWKTLLDQLGRSPSLAKAPPLSDEAISRESIYREREERQL